MSASAAERILVRLLVGACVLLIVADLVIDQHGHFAWEDWPGAYAVYGFLAYVGIVTLAKGLRRLVKRDESYYGAPDEATEREGDDARP